MARSLTRTLYIAEIAMARPYTEQESSALKKEFLEILTKKAGAVYLTCAEMSIPPTTYHYWRVHDKKFHDDCANIKESIKDRMEYSLVRDALEHGGSDRMFYMKTQMKDRGYIERVESVVRDEFKLTDTDLDLKERMRAQIIAEYEAAKNE